MLAVHTNFWQGRRGLKNFLLHFYVTIFLENLNFGKINFRIKHGFIISLDFGNFNDFLAPFSEYWQCTCTGCTVVFGAPDNTYGVFMKK